MKKITSKNLDREGGEKKKTECYQIVRNQWEQPDQKKNLEKSLRREKKKEFCLKKYKLQNNGLTYLSCGRGLINAIFKWKYFSNLDDNLVQTLSNAK